MFVASRSRQSVDLEVGPTGPWFAQLDPPWSPEVIIMGEPDPDIPVFLTSQSDLKAQVIAGGLRGFMQGDFIHYNFWSTYRNFESFIRAPGSEGTGCYYISIGSGCFTVFRKVTVLDKCLAFISPFCVELCWLWRLQNLTVSVFSFFLSLTRGFYCTRDWTDATGLTSCAGE